MQGTAQRGAAAADAFQTTGTSPTPSTTRTLALSLPDGRRAVVAARGDR